ncbi:MAG: hypothetical protein J6Z36_01790, partial [Clostridia bacterium]|nr:hypothetical protein [Clostridia bacterium]
AQMKADYKEQQGATLYYAAYYGTYDDCVVLYKDSDIPVIGELLIADVVFNAPNRFAMQIYHNHQFIELGKAFTDGLLSYESLKK